MHTTFRQPPSKLHRFAKYYIDRDTVSSLDEGHKKLETLSATALVGPAICDSYLDQVLLLTFVNVARRCYLGGINVNGIVNAPNRVPGIPGRTLKEAIEFVGGRVNNSMAAKPPYVLFAGAFHDGSDFSIRPIYANWWAGVSAGHIQPDPLTHGSSLGAVLAAGLTAFELFTYFEHPDSTLSIRPKFISLWENLSGYGMPASDIADPAVEFLPSELWLLGLGHLGQAYLWLLAMLSYDDPGSIKLFLQDTDNIDENNESTSVLTFRHRLGTPKTEVATDWAERIGFTVNRIERRLGPLFRREQYEPGICLAGIDNTETRRLLGKAGFDYVIDGGLGATARSFSRISIHTLPGSRESTEIWPATIRLDEPSLQQKAYQELAKRGIDTCGLAQLASRSVAAPFVGTVASCIALAQVLKPLHQCTPSELVSVDLRSLQYLQSIKNPQLTDIYKKIPFQLSTSAI